MVRLFYTLSLVGLLCILAGCPSTTPNETPKADPGVVEAGIQEAKERREEMGATDTKDVDAAKQATETTGG